MLGDTKVTIEPMSIGVTMFNLEDLRTRAEIEATIREHEEVPLTPNS